MNKDNSEDISVSDSQVGFIGSHNKVEGGIHTHKHYHVWFFRDFCGKLFRRMPAFADMMSFRRKPESSISKKNIEEPHFYTQKKPLDSSAIPSFPPKKIPVLPAWYKYISAIAIPVILITISYFILHKPKQVPMVINTDEHLDERIVLLGIEDKNFDITWRDKLAKLISRLAKAGTKVIVFDVTFEESSASDRILADSIKNALHQGTHIIAGFSDFKMNTPFITDTLRKSLSAYGLSCRGKIENNVLIMPMLMEKNGIWYRSLHAAAIEKYFPGSEFKVSESDVIEFIRKEKRPVHIKKTITVKDTVNYPNNDCPAIRESDVFSIRVVLHRPEAINHHLHSYTEVIGITDESALQNVFKDKIVIIGIRNGEDMIFFPDSESRYYGMDLYAVATDAILKRIEPK